MEQFIIYFFVMLLDLISFQSNLIMLRFEFCWKDLSGQNSTNIGRHKNKCEIENKKMKETSWIFCNVFQLVMLTNARLMEQICF